jgi:anti-sigma B factor antagonist
MADQLKLNMEGGKTPAPVLKLSGRLDVAGAKQLHAVAMASLKADQKKNLVVDLAGVEFVASTGLATFLLLTEEYAEVGGTIVFVSATQAVLQVINLLNINQFLQLERSVDEAFALMCV